MISKLKKPTDAGIKSLDEKIEFFDILEVYVPVYEARLIGPKKKIKILRIDGVRKKSFSYLIILSNSASSKNFSKISSSRAHVLIIFDCFTASLSKLSDSSTSFNAALLLAFA